MRLIDIEKRLQDKEEVSLYHADCMFLMKHMPDNSVDLTVTDIPYDALNFMRGTNREKYRGALRKNSKSDADIKTFELDIFISEVTRVTKGSIYIFCSSEQIGEIRSLLINKGLSTRVCVWEKTNPSPMNGEHLWLSGIELCVFGRKKGATFNFHCKNPVWRYPTARSAHPTPKPVGLIEEIIMASSNEGDVVFDPCLGSGSSGVAAIRNKRIFVGSEINEEYYNICLKNICQEIERLERV